MSNRPAIATNAVAPAVRAIKTSDGRAQRRQQLEQQLAHWVRKGDADRAAETRAQIDELPA